MMQAQPLVVWVSGFLSTFCLVSFGWAVKSFLIVDDDGGRRGKARLQWLGIPATALVVFAHFFPHVRMPGLAWGGIALLTFSGSLFWWVILTARKNRLRFAFSSQTSPELLQNGPYRLVRHPLYTAYLMTWTGTLLTTQNELLLVNCLALGTLYWQAARMEERIISESPHRLAYDAYRGSVGMFFPSLKPTAWRRGHKSAGTSSLPPDTRNTSTPTPPRSVASRK